MTVRIGGVVPQAAFFLPGEPWELLLTVWSDAATEAMVRIRPSWPAGQDRGWPSPPLDLGAGVGSAVVTERRVRLDPGLNQISWQIPDPPRQERGYSVEAAVDSPDGEATGRGAVDVLADWRADPRYGFLSEFGPGETGQQSRAATLAGLHLNCAQFYDWAYRHDQLLPPATEYRDPIGRSLSLASLRDSIAACRDRNIAPLGYAALYAGLPDFAAAHADWQITDGGSRPEHLAELFYLMNPGDKAGWQPHLLNQLAEALAVLDFDGFHLDQYGYPRIAWDRAGRPLNVGAGLACLAAAAGALVADRRPAGGVIANAVGAWPLDDFAAVAQVASYIEVWPPYDRYEDLVALTDRAKRSVRRPVLLAAYPSFLGAIPRPAPGRASYGLGYLLAVTLGAGAWPLLAGEGERVLVDPYYPNHVSPPSQVRTTLHSLFDFGVGYRDWLRGPQTWPIESAFISGPAAEWRFSRPHSTRPEAGRIWARASTSPGWTVLSLVNLLQVTDAAWDRPQPPPRATAVTVTLPRHLKDPACLVASPNGGLERLAVTHANDGIQVTVPLKLWSLLAIADSSAL